MTLAVIPARGGSKRIPRKNIRPFCGKPMMAWSIQAALASGCFDRVMVSTDDDEIARVALEWGAEVPFMRPAALADDFTGTIPVIAQVIEQLASEGEHHDQVCCLYATAPFVQAQDLASAQQQFQAESVDYAFSATRYAFPIQRALKLDEAGRVSMFQPEHFNTRSQDLEEAFHDAGQFYWGKEQAWLKRTPIFSPHSKAFVLPRHRVQDIDTEEDWTRAEAMFKALGLVV